MANNEAALRQDFVDTPYYVEDKGVSLTGHYRNVALPSADKEARVVSAIGRLGGGWARLEAGKEAVNILPPVAVTKGTAVRRLVELADAA